MTRNITKSDKIRILVNENKKLQEENKKLHELSNEVLSKQMIEEIEKFADATDALYKKYAELDKLCFMGLMSKLKYRWMIMQLKVKAKLGL